MSHCHVKDWFFVHPGDVVCLESGMCWSIIDSLQL
jgi:hypothetical protein